MDHGENVVVSKLHSLRISSCSRGVTEDIVIILLGFMTELSLGVLASSLFHVFPVLEGQSSFLGHRNLVGLVRLLLLHVVVDNVLNGNIFTFFLSVNNLLNKLVFNEDSCKLSLFKDEVHSLLVHGIVETNDSSAGSHTDNHGSEPFPPVPSPDSDEPALLPGLFSVNLRRQILCRDFLSNVLRDVFDSEEVLPFIFAKKWLILSICSSLGSLP